MHQHKCGKNNSQQQLYQCSSECSDHSLKSHSLSQHSHSSSQDRSRKSNCSGSCNSKDSRNHSHSSKNNAKRHQNDNCNGNDIANGNFNIYEHDDEGASERDHIIPCNSLSYPAVSEIDRHSDCCSSMGDADGDTCCSCSESSCLYAEATDPSQPITIAAQENRIEAQN